MASISEQIDALPRDEMLKATIEVVEILKSQTANEEQVKTALKQHKLDWQYFTYVMKKEFNSGLVSKVHKLVSKCMKGETQGDQDFDTHKIDNFMDCQTLLLALFHSATQALNAELKNKGSGKFLISMQNVNGVWTYKPIAETKLILVNHSRSKGLSLIPNRAVGANKTIPLINKILKKQKNETDKKQNEQKNEPEGKNNSYVEPGWQKIVGKHFPKNCFNAWTEHCAKLNIEPKVALGASSPSLDRIWTDFKILNGLPPNVVRPMTYPAAAIEECVSICVGCLDALPLDEQGEPIYHVWTDYSRWCDPCWKGEIKQNGCSVNQPCAKKHLNSLEEDAEVKAALLAVQSLEEAAQIQEKNEVATAMAMSLKGSNKLDQDWKTEQVAAKLDMALRGVGNPDKDKEFKLKHFESINQGLHAQLVNIKQVHATELEKLNHKFKQLEKDNSLLNAKITKLEQTLLSLTSLVKDKDEKISELQEQIEIKEEDYERVAEKLLDCRTPTEDRHDHETVDTFSNDLANAFKLKIDEMNVYKMGNEGSILLLRKMLIPDTVLPNCKLLTMVKPFKFGKKSGLQHHPILHSVRFNHEAELVRLTETPGAKGLEIGLGHASARMRCLSRPVHGVDPDFSTSDMTGYREETTAMYSYSTSTLRFLDFELQDKKVILNQKGFGTCTYVHLGNSIWYLGLDELETLGKIVNSGVPAFISGIHVCTSEGSFSYSHGFAAYRECGWRVLSAANGDKMISFKTDTVYSHKWEDDWYNMTYLPQSTNKFSSIVISKTVIFQEDNLPTLEYRTSKLVPFNSQNYELVPVTSIAGTVIRAVPALASVTDYIPFLNNLAWDHVLVNKNLLRELEYSFSDPARATYQHVCQWNKLKAQSYDDNVVPYAKDDLNVVPQLVNYLSDRAKKLKEMTNAPVETDPVKKLVNKTKLTIVVAGVVSAIAVSSFLLGKTVSVALVLKSFMGLGKNPHYATAGVTVNVIDWVVKQVKRAIVLAMIIPQTFKNLVQAMILCVLREIRDLCVYLIPYLTPASVVESVKNTLKDISLKQSFHNLEDSVELGARNLTETLQDVQSTPEKLALFRYNGALQAIVQVVVVAPIVEEILKHSDYGWYITVAILAIEYFRDYTCGSWKTALGRTVLHLATKFLPIQYAIPVHSAYNMLALLFARAGSCQ